MLAYTYISSGKFELIDKPKPELQSPRDAIAFITLGVSAPATCISSTAVCPVLCPA